MFKTQCLPTGLFLEDYFNKHNECADVELPSWTVKVFL